MICDGKKYHHPAATNFSGLLQGNSSNHGGDLHCLNGFNSYSTENKLKGHEEICNNRDSCHIEMPDWDNKIIRHNQGEKSLEAPFAIYLDLECILKKSTILSKQPWKILYRKKSYTWDFWLVNVYRMFIW